MLIISQTSPIITNTMTEQRKLHEEKLGLLYPQDHHVRTAHYLQWRIQHACQIDLEKPSEVRLMTYKLIGVQTEGHPGYPQRVFPQRPDLCK